MFSQYHNSHRIFKWWAKALISLRICAGWSEPLLVTHTTLLETSCHDSLYIGFVAKNPWLCYMWYNKDAYQPAHMCSLVSTFFFINYLESIMQSFKILASLCSWADWIASYWVAYYKDRFSCVQANILWLIFLFSLMVWGIIKEICSRSLLQSPKF